MTTPTISSIHRYSGRFQRSTDLVRDFEDPRSLEGYWLTDFGRKCLSRIGDGFRDGSALRAWRLTGDFGTGKSSFALLLANAARDGSHGLPRGLKEKVLASLPSAKNQRFVPVLVMGARESIAAGILRALRGTLGHLFARGSRSSLDQRMDAALNEARVSDEDALAMIQEATTKIVQTGKGDGVLLILDEAGKFLEFAACEPEQQDVFLLQRLGELACRSGKQPLVVVCLFHQGIKAYSEHLDQVVQREWDKVAGRFEEIPFQQPLDEVGQLIAAAINVDVRRVPQALQAQCVASMRQAIEMGWYGTSASRETLRSLPARVFPLDPFVLPVLVRFFHRYGQNERSLFTFLCGHEPFGLRAFALRGLGQDTSLLQLADFYDYVHSNFGARLESATYKAHWSVVESKIEGYRSDNLVEHRTLKTIGILNLLGATDLMPTRDALAWAVAGHSASDRRKVNAALDFLVEHQHLHFRGAGRGYSLWPYTSVDLDARLEDAKRVIPRLESIGPVIVKQLDSRPVVARAHYIKTGNLRYFDVIYCRPEELEVEAQKHETKADGLIIVPLCEADKQSEECKRTAARLPPRTDTVRLIAVPRGLKYLSQAALDSMRWEWVQSNTPELNNDRLARDEVKLYLQEARGRLQAQMQQAVGLSRMAGNSGLTWFFPCKEKLGVRAFESGREVLALLSDLCDRAYNEAPIIHNELINRHSPSPAATSARMRLVDRMFSSGHELGLGLPADRKPPERSMYLSVLKETGIHRETGSGWALRIPNAKSDQNRVRPVMMMIRGILARRPDARMGVADIMCELRRPPFGLRDGLFPILLAVVAIQDGHEIAFYEQGTFLRDVGRDAFLRVARAPERFELQLCRIEGVRSELFRRLTAILELRSDSGRDVELLDIVQTLCQSVGRLPEYVRNTRRLSGVARAVRDVIWTGREPVKMVFHDLPEACGMAKFEVGAAVTTSDARDFSEALRTSLEELRGAYFSLKNRMQEAFGGEFGFQNCALGTMRERVRKRAEELLVAVTEHKLKAFAFRLVDTGLAENEWLESLGSLITGRPPNRWSDEDEDTFVRELEALVGRFKRAESLAFSHVRKQPGRSALRVAVTQQDGTEKHEVVHFDADENDLLRAMEADIGAVMARNPRIGVAAASRAIWMRLKRSGDEA